jgi:hypothetical protein
MDMAQPLTITVDFAQGIKEKIIVSVSDTKAPDDRKLITFDSSKGSQQTKHLKPLPIEKPGGDKEGTIRRFQIRATHNGSQYCRGASSDGFVLLTKGGENEVVVTASKRTYGSNQSATDVDHVTIKLKQ